MELNKETNDVNDKKDSNDNKVVIENAADLYKTPISVLTSTKIYNFSGKYFMRTSRPVSDDSYIAEISSSDRYPSMPSTSACFLFRMQSTTFSR